MAPKKVVARLGQYKLKNERSFVNIVPSISKSSKFLASGICKFGMCLCNPTLEITAEMKRLKPPQKANCWNASGLRKALAPIKSGVSTKKKAYASEAIPAPPIQPKAMLTPEIWFL